MNGVGLDILGGHGGNKLSSTSCKACVTCFFNMGIIMQNKFN